MRKNEHIETKVKLRRFELVTLLETAEQTTGPENTLHNPDCDACASISFGELVQRMVGYVELHNWDEDETTCILIFTILKNHLLKASVHDPLPGNAHLAIPNRHHHVSRLQSSPSGFTSAFTFTLP